MQAPMYVLNVFIHVPINNKSLPWPLKRADPKYQCYLLWWGTALREGLSISSWGRGTWRCDMMTDASGPVLCWTRSCTHMVSSERWMCLCWLPGPFVAIIADTSDLSHLCVVDIQPGTRKDKCAVPPVVPRATAHLLFILHLPQITARSPGAVMLLERGGGGEKAQCCPESVKFGSKSGSTSSITQCTGTRVSPFWFLMHRALSKLTELCISPAWDCFKKRVKSESVWVLSAKWG